MHSGNQVVDVVGELRLQDRDVVGILSDAFAQNEADLRYLEAAK